MQKIIGIKTVTIWSIILFVTSGRAFAQDAGTALKNVAVRTPELIVAALRQHDFPGQNYWMAYYRTRAFRPFKEKVGDLLVTLYIYGDEKTANREVDQSYHSTQIAANRKDTFGGRRLYVWTRFGVRLLYQFDVYVVNIELDRRDERLAMTILQSLITELEFFKPKAQLIRVRDVPDPDRWTLAWGAQAAFFREQDFIVLPWEEASQLFQDRKVNGGKQYHTGWLIISCTNGETFLTQQPEIDFYIEAAKANSIPLTGFSSE